MTVVTLTGLERLLGAPGPIDAGSIEATYWAGAGPFVSVDGAEVVFPPAITVQIAAGAPVVELDMQPTAGECCVRWVVRSINGGFTLVRYTSVPASGPVDFGDLPVVDPASFAPVVATPTLIETIDARIAANPTDPAAIETAVADYLAENPPTSGVVHTQSVALSTWVIAHSFGRIPNVAVYVGGEQVDTDVTATASAVTVTFATPTAGVAVLN